jgi:hypothetical protein
VNIKRFTAQYGTTFDAGNAALPARPRNRVDQEYLFILGEFGGKTFNDGVF